MMTNEKLWQIALQQSAYDCNCTSADFLKSENVITISQKHPRARKYLDLPLQCDLVSYGSNIVAQVAEPMRPVIQAYLDAYPVSHCFETPHLHMLDKALTPYGLQTCFMAEYFLPDIDAIPDMPCPYECRVLHPSDFTTLYTPTWSNALCDRRRELDVLGVGAYEQGKLIAFAACSADGEEMYQIGIDVLPDYRRRGLAAALTSRLAKEILMLDKVPFYCAAWCNIASVRNAIHCGFRPAWVEVTAKEVAFVKKMNQKEFS